jgi:hypothetical protein
VESWGWRIAKNIMRRVRKVSTTRRKVVAKKTVTVRQGATEKPSTAENRPATSSATKPARAYIEHHDISSAVSGKKHTPASVTSLRYISNIVKAMIAWARRR